MIKDIFKKPIDRRIEGVIKADIIDDESVFNEVDEYVVTDELNRKLDDFFDVYSTTIGRPTQSIGVWISGFFGSGKSHLLKILSYILSSRSINSDLIGELFLTKIDDFVLKANIKKSLSIKADTLLFNIDTKADSGAGNRGENAILQVFLKVFNEHRGYYPKQPSIANFEKQLDDKRKYEEFKKAFLDINGNKWVDERDALTFVVDDAARALSKVQNISFESALEQLNKLDENFSISIEDFAQEVKEYIDKKEPNYRLIFLVDEVGQFIGDSTKVMLNLQSIVESLATTCLGQAWVVVTSQSAIKNLIESHNGLENDFSKIMGRFDVQINLTSQNANEVIQKRLLSKKEDVIPNLTSIYDTYKNSLKSIIHFSDRGLQFKNFENNNDFVLNYPFVPYQLELFQRCMIALSNNDMFQGKHASIGERSMLNVVQKVAIDISKNPLKTLASFDYFFDGISNIIRPELQTQITLAKNSLDDFTLKVLKILFLVKYVEGFSSNIENLTTLLVDSLEVDTAKLKQKVKNSLNTLLSQVYIQKVGDIYQFLTNIEKDIENEIKQIDISESDLNKELADWIYDDIIKINKVRFNQNKHDYIFARKLDGIVVKGKEEELSLNIISPLNIESYNETRIIHKSIADSDVIINLGEDFEFSEDLKTYLKTKKFIPLKRSNNLTVQENFILQTRGTDNDKRKKELIEQLKQKFIDAYIYYNGTPIEKKTSDVRKLIENIFNEIIPSIYTNVSMLNQDYNLNQIDTIIDNANDLFKNEESALDSATNEINIYLKREKQNSSIVTLQTILNYFNKRPYGWYNDAILCIVARLYGLEYITIKQNSNTLTDNEVKSALKNSRTYQNLILQPAIKIDEKVINRAIDILKELFPEGSFEKKNSAYLLENTKKLANNRVVQLKNYSNLNYPFKDAISKFLPPYQELLKCNIDNFFGTLDKLEDTLLDQYEDDIAKIIEFMEGKAKKVYDEIEAYLNNNRANLRHLDSQKINEIKDILKDENIYKNNKLPYAKKLKEELQKSFEPILEQAKQAAIKKIDKIIEQLQNDENFEKVPKDKRYLIIRPIQEIQKNIENQNIIDTIIAISNEEEILTKGLERIEENLPDDGNILKTKRVSISDIIPKGKRLKNKDDVEEYLTTLKNKLLEALNENDEIIS